MDSVTHIVLGACIGEAIAGKRIGKKAMLVGAVANSFPDIDVVLSPFLRTASDVLAHRGFTHSFLFIVLAAPLLAWLCVKLFSKNGEMSFGRWLFFWALQLLVHDVLDAFNAYGTGWFEPFSHYRVSFNTMYVADPLFTIWLLMASVALLILQRSSARRMTWVKVGLGLSIAYLLLGVGFKLHIDGEVRRDLERKHRAFDNVFSTPTMLNNILWYVVVPDDHGYYTGYRSVFDRDTLRLNYVYRNDSLLSYAAEKGDVELLSRFSQGYYTCQKVNDTVVFNILRFGEINGWAEQQPRFSCYYYLQYPDQNQMMIQRGRVAKWDRKTMSVFWQRIRGNR